MNFHKNLIYDDSEKDKTETYKLKVKELESMNDILIMGNKEQPNKILTKEDEEKLKTQNLYFKEFLTGNLSKIINNREKANKNRKYSYVDLQELKNFKKRASFYCRKNNQLYSPRSKDLDSNKRNYEKLGYLETSPEKKPLGMLKKYRYSLGTPSYNAFLYNKTEVNGNHHFNFNKNFDYSSNSNVIKSKINHDNYIIYNYPSEDHKKFENIDYKKHKESQNSDFDRYNGAYPFDSNRISKTNTLGNYDKTNLHPRLSIRINQFLNDLQKKTQQFSRDEYDYESLYQNTDTENGTYQELGNKWKLENQENNLNLINGTFHLSNSIKNKTNIKLNSELDNKHNKSNFNYSVFNNNINSDQDFNKENHLKKNNYIKKVEFKKDLGSVKTHTLGNIYNKYYNLNDYYNNKEIKKENNFSYEVDKNYQNGLLKSTDRNRRILEEKNLNKPIGASNSLGNFLEAMRINNNDNKTNIKETKKNINYNCYDIDRRINANEYSSPEKMRKIPTITSIKETISHGIFKAPYIQINQTSRRNESNNLLKSENSNNLAFLKNKNKKFINEESKELEREKNHEIKKDSQKKSNISEDDIIKKKSNNFKSNSFKMLQTQRPIINNEILALEYKKFHKTSTMQLSPQNTQNKKYSDSFDFENNEFIKSNNFFENFENEIDKQKQQIYRFNSGKLFCNFDKEVLLEKLQRKHQKINEKEKKRELSRKKVNFLLSDSKIKNSALDFSSLNKKNSNFFKENLPAKYHKDTKHLDLNESMKRNNNDSSELKLESELKNRDKFRYITKRDHVEDSLSDEEEFEILNNSYDGGYLIEYDSSFRKFWDFIITLITLYTLIIAPFRLAFDDLDFVVVDYLEITMDGIFIMDIALQFFIPNYNIEEDLIKNKSLIAKNYLSGWFCLDLIASIPGSIISNLLEPDTNMMNSVTSNSSISKINKVTRITKFYKILKFTKLSKIIKISTENSNHNHHSHIPSLEDLNISSSIKRMINFFLVFVLVSHIITCIWIFIGDSTYPNWICHHKIIDGTTGDLYISSLYFHWTTIFTIGYGDIISTNSYERLYNCILMFVGVLIYSFAVSSLGTIVSSYDGITLKFMKNMEHLQEISRRYNVPDKFNEKVYKYLRYDYKFNKSEKFAFINELPIRLKNSLLINMYREVIRNFNFLKENSVDFTSKVVFMMKPLRMHLKEYIITEGEFLEEVIFVRRGHLTIHLGKNYNEHKIMEIRKNEHFGDILVLSNLRSPVTIKVGSKMCDLLIIKKQDLLEIAADFPESIEEIFLVSSFNHSSLIELIELKKKKLDSENEKLKNRKIEFLNFLNTKYNNASLVENINVIEENKRVVDDLNKRIESEMREKEYENTFVRNDNSNKFNSNIKNNHAFNLKKKKINEIDDDYSINKNNNFSDKLYDLYTKKFDFKSNLNRNTISYSNSKQNNNKRNKEDNKIGIFDEKLNYKNSKSDALKSSNKLYYDFNFKKISDNCDFSFKNDLRKNFNKQNIDDEKCLILIDNKSSTDTILNNDIKYLNYNSLKKNKNFAFIYNKLKSDNDLDETFNDENTFEKKSNLNDEKIFKSNSNIEVLKETNFTNLNDAKNLELKNSIDNVSNKLIIDKPKVNIIKINSDKSENTEGSCSIPEENIYEKDYNLNNFKNISSPLGHSKLNFFKNNPYILEEENIIKEEKEDLTEINFSNEKIISSFSCEKSQGNNIFNRNNNLSSQGMINNFNKRKPIEIESTNKFDQILKNEIDIKKVNSSKISNESVRINNEIEFLSNSSEEKSDKLTNHLNKRENNHKKQDFQKDNKNNNPQYVKFISEKEIKGDYSISDEIYSLKSKGSNYSSISNIILNNSRENLNNDDKFKNSLLKESSGKLSLFNQSLNTRKSFSDSRKNDINIGVFDDYISADKKKSCFSSEKELNINKKHNSKIGNENIINLIKNKSNFSILKNFENIKENKNKLRRSIRITSKSLEHLSNNKFSKKNSYETDLEISIDSNELDDSNGNNKSTDISFKCTNCNHNNKIDEALLIQLQNEIIKSLKLDSLNQKINKYVPRIKSSEKSLNKDCFKESPNINNIYNIYNNCRIDQNIENIQKITLKDQQKKFSQTDILNSIKNIEKTLFNKISLNVNSNTDSINDSKKKNKLESKMKNLNLLNLENQNKVSEEEFNSKNYINNYDSNIEISILNKRKSLSEEFNKKKYKNSNSKNCYKSSKYNKKKHSIKYEVTDGKINNTLNNVSEDNITSRRIKIPKKELSVNGFEYENERNLSSKSPNNKTIKKFLKHLSPSESSKNKFPFKNKIKENLKNVRNRLKYKDSSKFKKSREIVHNIYNSIFYRNKVLNNPDEFYFNEFKILFKTGLEEEIKKESIKINNIIVKIIKLSKFSENYNFDEKKNIVEIKKINAKTSDDLDFKLDVPFMLLDKGK